MPFLAKKKGSLDIACSQAFVADVVLQVSGVEWN